MRIGKTPIGEFVFECHFPSNQSTLHIDPHSEFNGLAWNLETTLLPMAPNPVRLGPKDPNAPQA